PLCAAATARRPGRSVSGQPAVRRQGVAGDAGRSSGRLRLSLLHDGQRAPPASGRFASEILAHIPAEGTLRGSWRQSLLRRIGRLVYTSCSPNQNGVSSHGTDSMKAVVPAPRFPPVAPSAFPRQAASSPRSSWVAIPSLSVVVVNYHSWGETAALVEQLR